jgi:hypothetical protein
MAKQTNMQRSGEWSRWVCGSSQGWSLEIGGVLCGSVVKRVAMRRPTTWTASVNMTGLGDYLDCAEAMRGVEEHMENTMALMLNDWELYRAAKAVRATRQQSG